LERLNVITTTGERETSGAVRDALKQEGSVSTLDSIWEENATVVNVRRFL
jgi:hypothetical protein